MMLIRSRRRGADEASRIWPPGASAASNTTTLVAALAENAGRLEACRARRR